MDTIEQWRQIAEFPDYEVSESGGVRRAVAFKEWEAGRHLRFKIADGYKYVALYRNRKVKYMRVNRLVAEAFIGPAPTPRHLALHWDGDRQHNHFTNLRWGTHRENIEDMNRHGTAVYIHGEEHHGAQLTEEIVREARQLKQEGHSYREISEVLLHPVSTLVDAIRGTTWGHVA